MKMIAHFWVSSMPIQMIVNGMKPTTGMYRTKSTMGSTAASQKEYVPMRMPRGIARAVARRKPTAMRETDTPTSAQRVPSTASPQRRSSTSAGDGRKRCDTAPVAVMVTQIAKRRRKEPAATAM